MVKTEIIRRRLLHLEEYLSILRHYADYSFDDFVSDPERYGSAERFLQLAIEATVDIGNHVIADLGIGSVEKGSDVPRLLHERGLIDPDLQQRWIRMIGFRNILVHEYGEIDRRIVYDVVCQRLADLDDLGRVFARLL
jgi:uncharacterized protein YutE (UPF0331/DUF86 family)